MDKLLELIIFLPRCISECSAEHAVQLITCLSLSLCYNSLMHIVLREKDLAKKYYDKLFKEYCIADLSKYKENKVGLISRQSSKSRWRQRVFFTVCLYLKSISHKNVFNLIFWKVEWFDLQSLLLHMVIHNVPMPHACVTIALSCFICLNVGAKYYFSLQCLPQSLDSDGAQNRKSSLETVGLFWQTAMNISTQTCCNHVPEVF